MVGVWDEQAIRTIDTPRVMVYGPQGSQHFFVDALVGVAASGRLRLEFDFIEKESGELAGAGRWQREIDACGTVFKDIPIVVDTDERIEGELSLRATLGQCSWQLDVGAVVALPPLFDEDVESLGAGTASGPDAGTAAGLDAGTAAGLDAGTAAGLDAGTVAGSDAATSPRK